MKRFLAAAVVLLAACTSSQRVAVSTARPTPTYRPATTALGGFCQDMQRQAAGNLPPLSIPGLRPGEIWAMPAVASQIELTPAKRQAAAMRAYKLFCQAGAGYAALEGK